MPSSKTFKKMGKIWMYLLIAGAALTVLSIAQNRMYDKYGVRKK
jgi:hypothetical protein